MASGIPIGQMPPPGMVPPGAGGPPPPPMAPPPPSAGGGPMSGMFLLLSFLAGAGLDKATNSVGKIAKLIGGGGQGADPTRQHKGGIRMEAAQNPGMTIAPQMAQMLASKAGQQPSGSDDLISLLIKALQGSVGPGPMPPGGASPLGRLG